MTLAINSVKINLSLAVWCVTLISVNQLLAQVVTPLPTNCIAWWRAEGNSADSVGFNEGVMLNGATASAVGVVGSAFSFDGTNGYVLVPDSSTLKPRNLTIEGWFSFRDVGTVQCLISKPIGSGNRNSYTLFYGDGALRGFTARPSADNLSYPWTPVLGQWYHLAYTFDDDRDSEALYIDGLLVRSTNAPGSISYDSHPVLIGADFDFETPSGFFHGQADEVAIYERALSEGELAAIHAAGGAGKSQPPALPNFTDDFSAGLSTNDWLVTQNDPSYAWDASMGEVRFSRPVGGSNVLNYINMRYQRPLSGDFDARIDFRGANINRTNGAPGNQIEMQCQIGSQLLAIVRSDEVGAGHNAHVWWDPPATNWAGTISTTATSGTLRIRRTGVAVDLYLDQKILYSATCTTNPVCYLAFALKNNGTTDPTAVTFDNFRVQAGTILPLSPTITAQPVGTTLRWNEYTLLSVAVVGAAPLAYQWRHSGTNLPGGTSSTLNIAGFDTNNAGLYDAVITNAFGVVTSQVAQIAILPSMMRGLVPPGLPIYTYVANILTSPEPWNWGDARNWSGPGRCPEGNAVAVFVTAGNLTPPWSIRPPADGVAYLVFEGGEVWMGHGGKVGNLIVTGGELNFDAEANTIAVYGGSHTISAWNCQRLELWGGTLSMTGGAEGYPDAFINLYGPFLWYGGTWDGGSLYTLPGSQILLPPRTPDTTNAVPKWLNGVVHGDLTTSTGVAVVSPGATLEIAGGTHHLRGWGIQNGGRILWSGGDIAQTTPSTIANAQAAVFQITGGVNLTGNGSFQNQGQLLKTDNSNTSSIGAYFDHTGVVAVSNGWLAFTAGGVLQSNLFLASEAGAILQAQATFSCWGDFNLGAGTLRVMPPYTEITGTNSVSSGVLELAGGILREGFTRIGSNALLRVSGSAAKAMDRYTIDNQGHAVWQDSGQLGWNSSVVNNLVGGVFEAVGDARFTATTFNNSGRFRKRDSTGTTQFYSNSPFNNEGSVEVRSGRLQLGGGGTIQAPLMLGTNATIEFAGGWTTVNGEFTWPHAVFSDALGNDHLVLNGVFHVGQFDYTGSGYSQLHGTNVIDGVMTWDAGGMQDGVTAFTSNSVLRLSGAARKYMNNCTVNNQGRIEWRDGGIFGGQASVLNNLAGGVFEALGDARLQGTTFNNSGVFRKRDSTGTTQFYSDSPFYNAGQIDALAGQVSLTGGYTVAGGSLNFGIAGGTNFGSVTVSGNAPLAGSLRATLLNGYKPATNASFQVMTFGSHSGGFGDTSGLNVGNGRYFQPVITPTDLTLVAWATNNPVLSGATRLPDGNLQWSVTDEIPGVYSLQESTNLISWNLLTLLTNTTGTVYFIDPSATNLPFRFYRTAPPQ